MHCTEHAWQSIGSDAIDKVDFFADIQFVNAAFEMRQSIAIANDHTTHRPVSQISECFDQLGSVTPLECIVPVKRTDDTDDQRCICCECSAIIDWDHSTIHLRVDSILNN